MLVAFSVGATSALRAHAAPASVASPSPASVADQVAWSMMPVITDVGEERSNFAYAVDPGATIDDAVLVRNSGTSALTLAVYGSDAFTDESGALDIATTEPGSGAIGTWITPSVESVSIEPGGLVRIPFTLNVPADAQPGEHAGALLTVLESSGDTVSVDMRYATRVTATVAGDLTAGMSLDRARFNVETGFWPWESATASVAYDVRNTGNTRLSAVQLITSQGVEMYSSPDAATGLTTLAELLPEAAVSVDATVKRLTAWTPFAALHVAVSPTVLVPAGAEAPTIDQQQVTLTAVAIAPGWWVILAALAAGVFVIFRLVTGRRRPAPHTPR